MGILLIVGLMIGLLLVAYGYWPIYEPVPDTATDRLFEHFGDDDSMSREEFKSELCGLFSQKKMFEDALQLMLDRQLHYRAELRRTSDWDEIRRRATRKVIDG